MVKLRKMNNEDFNDYIANAVDEYAKEHVKAGNWAEEQAQKLSEEAFAKLLPQKSDTKDQYLYTIINEKEIKIGYLWFKYSESLIGKEAFIYDFYIFENYRGKGYGTKSMNALDEKVRELNIDKVSLHVFSHNKKAIELYKKVGFIDTDILMAKYIKND